MRGSVLFSFALLLTVAQKGPAQDVVSASSGVLQYFEGTVVLDDKPVEHKTAVFPSLKNGSVIRTAKGRAELMLTPGVFLRVDENSSLRMVSNSLTDTRLEVTEGAAILDNLNASSSDAVVLIYAGSEVRFPKPGIYRLDCDLGELQAYSGEAKVTHRGTSSLVDSSKLYYFTLELTTTKFGDGAVDEFYDWAHNRSDVIADQNQVASAEQDDAQDPDPVTSSGMYVIPPIYSSPTYATPSTSVLGYSAYGSAFNSFYLYPPYLGYAPFSSIIVLSPYRYRPGAPRWPRTPGSPRWPTSTQGVLTHIPTTPLRYPMGVGTSISRPGMTVPHITSPSVAAHPAVPHAVGGHR